MSVPYYIDIVLWVRELQRELSRILWNERELIALNLISDHYFFLKSIIFILGNLLKFGNSSTNNW